MAHDVSMVTAGDRLESARARMMAAIADYAAAMRAADAPTLGAGLIHTREARDRLESIFVEGVGRFERSRQYLAAGALDVVSWLRSNCKLSGGAAAERVGVARQLEHLPQTQTAFARGDLGYQHVAVMARTAEHVGAATVRKAEASLLQAAATMDPGQFNGVVKSFEHRVDAAAALAGANRAHERRYLHLSEARDGLVRLDGQLDTEGGAILRTALDVGMLPGKDDDRTPGQRRADALIELCRRRAGGSADGAGPRPHLIIRATLDTLTGAPGSAAGELEAGGAIPAETVRRLACDAALTRITGTGELDAEISRASRTISPATRRALATRDRGCVAATCDRPPTWTDAHHLHHWAHGGPTTLPNLVLVCRRHHRMIHEGGWQLRRLANGRWGLIPPVKVIPAHARSA